MKKSVKNLFYFAIAGLFLLTSCNFEEGETPAPTLIITNGASIPKEVNQSEEISSLLKS